MVRIMDTKFCCMYSKQSGFALFMVLIIMVIIAFLVVSTMQSSAMDSRTSANDSDRQLAIQNAQRGLEDAEDTIRGWGNNAINQQQIQRFTCNCTGGLCAAKGMDQSKVGPDNVLILNCPNTTDLPEVWLRDNGNILSGGTKDTSLPLNAGTAEKAAPSGQYFRYVIEYLGKNNNSKFLFRITAKGWGQNSSTTGMVQEVVEATMPHLNLPQTSQSQ